MLDSIVRFLFDSIDSNISMKKISDTTALLKSYILYKVNRFDIKGKQLLKTQEKYYLSDIGLRSYLLGKSFGKDLGHILKILYFLN